MIDAVSSFRLWMRTIGSLSLGAPLVRFLLAWAGYLLFVSPILIWQSLRKRIAPPGFIALLLVATFLLTLWQARWSYFFVAIFVIVLPGLLAPIKSAPAVWSACVLSILPRLQCWATRLWPHEVA